MNKVGLDILKNVALTFTAEKYMGNFVCMHSQ